MLTNKVTWIIGIIMLLLFATYYISRPGTAAVVTSTAELPGMQTSDAPWAPEIIHLRERLDAIQLPALAKEGVTLHTHQHLDIFINGKPVAVPANIGIHQAAGFISIVHVHDPTGVIHVESPTVSTFYLGQFFDIWGVRFTKDCIGGYCSGAEKTLLIYVNGTLYSDDPRQLALEAHQEIVITYGTANELPSTIPAAYTFPNGE